MIKLQNIISKNIDLNKNVPEELNSIKNEILPEVRTDNLIDVFQECRGTTISKIKLSDRLDF